MPRTIVACVLLALLGVYALAQGYGGAPSPGGCSPAPSWAGPCAEEAPHKGAHYEDGLSPGTCSPAPSWAGPNAAEERPTRGAHYEDEEDGAVPVQGYGDALVNAQEKARRLKCQNNLKQVYAAIQEFGGRPKDLQVLVDRKLIDKRLLKCPSANTAADAIDYAVASSGDILCRCRQAWHQGGRNVLKSDGTVTWEKQ